MTPDDAHFFDAVTQVVTRYGMKRSTVAEVARGVGVSRQTLYDRFGDKDGLMAATVDHMGERLLADLRAGFASAPTLSDKIDCFYQIAIWPLYEIFQAMPDAADLETGMGPASVAASDHICLQKRAVLAEMLEPHLKQDAPSPAQLAFFIEQTSTQAKSSGMARDDLAQLLSVLKASTLALAKPS